MTITLKLKRPDSKRSAIITAFTRNSLSYKLYTGKSIDTKNWSQTKEKVLSGEENYDLINLFLEKWVDKLKRIFEELEANGELINEIIIKAKMAELFSQNGITSNEISGENDTSINGEKTIKVIDFTTFMQSFIQLKEEDGKFLQKLEQAQKTVLMAFNLISKDGIKKYNKLSNKQKSATELVADYKLPFSHINLQFIQKFKSYLNKATYITKEKKIEVEKHYTTNYIDKQINGLKQFINGAIEAKYVPHFTWGSLQSNGNEVDNVFTDFKEIQQINDIYLEDKNEIEIRDSYIINCFLGFRYSDFSRLEPHSFKNTSVKGNDILIYSGRNKKTGQLVEFPIHPIAASLLQKYNFKIPKHSAQEFNEVIKIVAKKAGLIDLIRISETRAGKTTTFDIPMCELICTHSGRRSFCTNFYIEGVAIQILMSISGHKTEKEFMKYIKKRSVRIEVAAEQIFAIKGINLGNVA